MDYLELIARVTSHIHDKGQVMVRDYGPYANAHRGKARRPGGKGKAPKEGYQTQLMAPTPATKKRFVSAHEKSTSISGPGSLSASSK